MGRPAKITPEVFENVCDELALGDKSLRALCRERGFTHTAFLLQLRGNEEFTNQYTRAVDLASEAAFDGLRDLASEIPCSTQFGVDSAWVNWRRLQIDTLKWELSRRNPKKFSDKLAHTGADGVSDPVFEVRTRSILEDGGK